MKAVIAFLVSFAGLLVTESVAQQPLNHIEDSPSFTVFKTGEKIILDGMFEEEDWKKAETVQGFAQIFPADSIAAKGQTEIKMLYGKTHLYIGITCKSSGGNFMTSSLRRDYGFFGSDNLALMFDTYNDKVNALMFGINAYGVRREATISNAGQQGDDFDLSWDNKWDAGTKKYADHWTAEVAIPFTTLRFKEGCEKWRFNAYRNDTQENEVTMWVSMPSGRIYTDLAYMGDMIWETPLRKPGQNISVIPYALGAVSRDYEDATETSSNFSGNFGGDAKISLTSGLNLDLTVNPDFSQVEVDRQVTNLDRFEIFFPEKRQFFLENADLFSGFGAGRINPFFSRRIGVAIDTATGTNIQNSILYGARLSGKLNEKLRIGALNMQTAAQQENGLPMFNYSVATAEQRFAGNSTIRGMFVNKMAVNSKGFKGEYENYNRVGGIEYRYNSKDNSLTARASAQRAFTPGATNHREALFYQAVYNKRKYRLEWTQMYIGANFNPEVGFAPRRDILLTSPEASVNFFVNSDKVSFHKLGFDASMIYKLGKDGNTVLDDFSLQEFNFKPEWSIRFVDNSRFTVNASYNDLTLLNDFDPTRVQADSVFLPAGTRYQYSDIRLSYSSDSRKTITYRIRPEGGTFFNGNRFGISGNLTYRFRPYGSFGVEYNYNSINLEAPFTSVDLWLIGPRLDLTFTRKIFLTTFVQYNNQLDNLNINARFQWRFKPVSDFFIVYTDNYLTEPFSQFGSRNRALVAKFTYWFNL